MWGKTKAGKSTEASPQFYVNLCISLTRYGGKRDWGLDPLKEHVKCLLPLSLKRLFINLTVSGGWSFGEQDSGNYWETFHVNMGSMIPFP